MNEKNGPANENADQNAETEIREHQTLTGGLTQARLVELREAMQRGEPVPGNLSPEYLKKLSAQLGITIKDAATDEEFDDQTISEY